MAREVHTAEVYPGVRSMKQQGVFALPCRRDSSYFHCYPCIKSPHSRLHAWMEKVNGYRLGNSFYFCNNVWSRVWTNSNIVRHTAWHGSFVALLRGTALHHCSSACMTNDPEHVDILVQLLHWNIKTCLFCQQYCVKCCSVLPGRVKLPRAKYCVQALTNVAKALTANYN